MQIIYSYFLCPNVNSQSPNQKQKVTSSATVSQIAHLRLTINYSLLSVVDKKESVKKIKHSRILVQVQFTFLFMKIH